MSGAVRLNALVRKGDSMDWKCPGCQSVNNSDTYGEVACNCCGTEYEIYANENGLIALDRV